MKKTSITRAAVLLGALSLLWLSLPATALSASATEINIKVDDALRRFSQEVAGGQEFLNRAAGVLVFPEVIKAGFGLGAEYGEGALRIGGRTVRYYNTMAASIGFQAGAQMKSIVLVFMNQTALTGFMNSDGWQAGVDGSVALLEWGTGKDINTMDISDPVVGFVFNNKGLMYNLNLEGSKITRIVR